MESTIRLWDMKYSEGPTLHRCCVVLPFPQNSIFLSGSQIRGVGTLEEIGRFVGGAAGVPFRRKEIKWFQLF
jgi:hypothetical protein